MSLETALQSLHTRLGELQTVLSEVTPFITDVRVPVPLVDDLDNGIAELTGTAEEAAASVNEAMRVTQPDGSLDAVVTALGQAQAALNRCTAAYVGLFVPEIPEHASLIEKLLGRGQKYGRQWLDWSTVVHRSIGLCAAPLHACAQALGECWHELAVRLARQSVSVQATNIGQQITMRDDRLELIGKAT